MLRLVLPLACLLVPSFATECTFTLSTTSGESYDFDLGDLRSSSDYTGDSDDGEFNFVMNFCGNAVTSTCTGNVCQYDSDGNLVAQIGSWTDSPSPVWALLDPDDGNGGVTLTHTNGDYCDATRTTIVDFLCDSSQTTTFIVSEPSMCSYEIEFKTPLVCPLGVPSSLTGGGIFLIILSSATFVYLAGGCYYKKSKKGTTGMESMPNIDFWRAFPGYVKVGCKVSYDWINAKISGKEAVTKYDEL